jgi:predicted DNA-binding protein with PD1-like motif
MKSKLLSERGDKTFMLVFDKGDEVMAELLAFVKTEKIGSAHFNALGAFSDVTFGFFERDRKEYKPITAGRGEVMSLVGNVAATEDGEPKIHAHVVVGKEDGSAHGGHLLEGHVWPTMEMILVLIPESLLRKIDDETGLPLIDLGGK